MYTTNYVREWRIEIEMEKLNSNIIIDPLDIAEEMIRIYDYQGDDFIYSNLYLIQAMNNLYNLEQGVNDAIKDKDKHK